MVFFVLFYPLFSFFIYSFPLPLLYRVPEVPKDYIYLFIFYYSVFKSLSCGNKIIDYKLIRFFTMLLAYIWYTTQPRPSVKVLFSPQNIKQWNTQTQKRWLSWTGIICCVVRQTKQDGLQAWLHRWSVSWFEKMQMFRWMFMKCHENGLKSEVTF